jgi:hypothetical protein
LSGFVSITASAASLQALLEASPELVATLLMMPLALIAWALGGWRLAAELQWIRDFVIRTGTFSRWQFWIALGIVAQFASFLLHGYARRRFDREDAALS